MKIDTVAYDRVHSALGFYDASQTYGRVLAQGRDVLDLIHRMSTNDIKPLEGKPGTATQTVLTNEKGRIIDLLTVLSRHKDALLVTSGWSESRVIDWLNKFVIMEDARFTMATSSIRQFVVCGPRALDFFREYTTEDLISMPSMNWISVEIGGFPVTLQKLLRIAESGWQVFVDREIADDVKRILEARVLELGGAVIDEALFDTLRIESGIPISPNEINDKRNPLETTLVSAVSFKKGCYIGQEVIARLDSYDKVQRHMMGLILDGSIADLESEVEEAVTSQSVFVNAEVAIPEFNGAVLPHNYQELPVFKVVLPAGSEAAKSVVGKVMPGGRDPLEIGEMTSYAPSPGMNRVIGLAFIRSAHSNPGQKVEVHLSGERVLGGVLVKLPFDV